MYFYKMKKLFFVILFSIACLQVTGQNFLRDPFPDTVVKKRLRSVVYTESATYAAGLGFIQFIWYKGEPTTKFHFYNDNAGYLQIDKFGHAYSAYQESYKGYYALRWAGLPKKKAIWYGGLLGVVMQTPIEIYDGIYEDFGFSYGDMIANSFGSALFMVQEQLYDDQIIKMKFSYSPSGIPDYRPWYFGESEIERFFTDYNGHTYWFSANLNKLIHSDKIPDWLNIAVGYSANGMLSEFENPAYSRGVKMPDLKRYRELLVSLDIDLTKIKSNKKFFRFLLRQINLIKIPFPAIEWNRVEGVKFRPFYF